MRIYLLNPHDEMACMDNVGRCLLELLDFINKDEAEDLMQAILVTLIQHLCYLPSLVSVDT